ncbi:MAG: nucleotide exchange factor GrpE [Candidatus Methylomirabilia bacterium]
MSDESTPRDETPEGHGVPGDQEPGGVELPAQIIEEELTRLRQALEEKTREAEAGQDRCLRALAELDNVRKRAQRDREDYIRFANESLVRDLLPVLDNFDRAIEAAHSTGEAPGLLTGVELVRRELLRVLEKFGLTAYSAVGHPFDPERHEAVARVGTSDHSEMTVVEETRRGYLLNGRVLRPAMVTVAVPPEEASGSDG